MRLITKKERTELFEEFLRDNYACSEGRIWAKGRTFREAVRLCRNRSWLTWLQGVIAERLPSYGGKHCSCGLCREMTDKSLRNWLRRHAKRINQ